MRFTTVLTPGIRKLPNNEWKVITLPPMLIYKNLVKPPKGKFPTGMCVLGSKGGSMTGKMMKESYVPMIYKGRPGGYFNAGNALFLMDSATCHKGEDIIDAFKTVNTDVKYIYVWIDPTFTIS